MNTKAIIALGAVGTIALLILSSRKAVAKSGPHVGGELTDAELLRALAEGTAATPKAPEASPLTVIQDAAKIIGVAAPVISSAVSALSGGAVVSGAATAAASASAATGATAAVSSQAVTAATTAAETTLATGGSNIAATMSAATAVANILGIGVSVAAVYFMVDTIIDIFDQNKDSNRPTGWLPKFQKYEWELTPEERAQHATDMEMADYAGKLLGFEDAPSEVLA